MGALFSTSGGSWFSGFFSWWGKRSPQVKPVKTGNTTQISPGDGVGFTKSQLQRFRNAENSKSNGNISSMGMRGRGFGAGGGRGRSSTRKSR